MIRTVEAVIDENGGVRLLEPLSLDRPMRALVMVLEKPAGGANEAALLAEEALAADWERPEEDEAWAYLQMEK